jgi:hypothetical protein
MAQGRFAATALADQAQGLTFLQGKADAIDSPQIVHCSGKYTFFNRKVLFEVANF